MAVTRYTRKWLCGAACLSLAAAGCAQTGGQHAAGTGWSRMNPAHVFAKKQDGEASPKVQIAYARWQEQLGNLTEARQSYEQVLGNDPKSADAVLGLARLDQLAGRPSLAEQGYQKALKLNPDDPAVRDAAGQFYVSQQRWKEAVEHLNKAMLGAPEEPTYRFHLAVALARSGDVPASMPHFVKSVGDAEAHYNVGYILYEKGELAAAEQQFLQAVLKRPDLQEAQVMLDELRRGQEEQQLFAGPRAPVQRTAAQAMPAAAMPPAAQPFAPAPQSNWQQPPTGRIAMGPAPQQPQVPVAQPVSHTQPAWGGPQTQNAFLPPRPAPAQYVTPYAQPGAQPIEPAAWPQLQQLRNQQQPR